MARRLKIALFFICLLLFFYFYILPHNQKPSIAVENNLPQLKVQTKVFDKVKIGIQPSIKNTNLHFNISFETFENHEFLNVEDIEKLVIIRLNHVLQERVQWVLHEKNNSKITGDLVVIYQNNQPITPIELELFLSEPVFFNWN